MYIFLKIFLIFLNNLTSREKYNGCQPKTPSWEGEAHTQDLGRLLPRAPLLFQSITVTLLGNTLASTTVIRLRVHTQGLRPAASQSTRVCLVGHTLPDDAVYPGAPWAKRSSPQTSEDSSNPKAPCTVPGTKNTSAAVLKAPLPSP